ncbi:low molecular weight phosphotyrosine protein phosphatase [Aeromicrobium marinum DSM 15272]|uniref:Low molecular weight phosphotyrosine protein phosphatase n=1 Tax=Aeromicrobium marinum DSM 15272 TaxID=585531 RepID=E2SBQ3_9ACTN|nr:low molecular weight phosphotyrosine protein phosphatase [Aeromicrobium marinum DSM 15272]
MAEVTRRFTVLAVCTANICRSPIMEVLLRSRLDPRHFEVASAGVRGWDRSPMDAMAAMELMRLGHDPTGFESHPIDGYLVGSANLVLTATREHRSAVLEHSPLALRRSFTLLEFADLVDTVDADSPPALVAEAARLRGSAGSVLDIQDPYRRSPQVHRDTADEIDRACSTIAARLNALVGVGGSSAGGAPGAALP